VIVDLIKKFGGNSVLTSKNHATGTDRVFQVFKETLNNEPNIIVNLQGDMPNIDSKDITNLINYMQKEECSIGTLASKLKSNYELKDKNIVKVCVKEKMRPGEFVQAEDFVRTNPNKLYQVYHHIGIYAFTNKALIRYVGLKRSKLELQRNLEQLRAMENNISIHVGFVESSPLSVDTEKDLIEVKKLMEKNG
jgi:3-deoxy-manno-octulosonate cytidylyltransferase (CMP-KDO synthetase)